MIQKIHPRQTSKQWTNFLHLVFIYPVHNLCIILEMNWVVDADEGRLERLDSSWWNSAMWIGLIAGLFRYVYLYCVVGVSSNYPSCTLRTGLVAVVNLVDIVRVKHQTSQSKVRSFASTVTSNIQAIYFFTKKEDWSKLKYQWSHISNSGHHQQDAHSSLVMLVVSRSLGMTYYPQECIAQTLRVVEWVENWTVLGRI